MPSLSFEVLKRENTINGKKYPMYIGFLPAIELLKISEVPSFSVSKTHFAIATEALDTQIEQWQRTLEEEKVNKIKGSYNDSNKDNLMANPILLGVAKQNLLPPNISITIGQKFITHKGDVVPIENLYTINLSYEIEKHRPLWILDGQHRVHGMSESNQRNEYIPFVLLHESNLYNPAFLAEIFTHVTTGAKPMEPIHGEWMKYAFRLDQYKERAYENAMKTTMILCKEQAFNGTSNPFHNKIQFNPYQSNPRWDAFDFNSIEWKNLIAIYYFGRGGSFLPYELAQEIVLSTLAFEELDSYKNNNSKLFSDNHPHRTLAEAYLIGLLAHLANSSQPMTLQDWKSFYLDTRRAVDRCNWSLPFVQTPGALSSNNGAPSKKIVTDCFRDFFSDPNKLNNNLLSDFLEGIGASFKITAYEKTPSGAKKKSTKIEKVFNPGGKNFINLSLGGHNRSIIVIESCTSNLQITKVQDTSVKPHVELKTSLTQKGLDVTSYRSGKIIDIDTISYSGDTRKTTEIRIDK